MQLSTLATLLPLLGAVSAAPGSTRSRYALKERHVVPRGWTESAQAVKSHMVHLQIGLKQSNADEIDRHVMEVSTPTHERYGQHLSADEIERLIAPSQNTADLVHEWLAEHGIAPDSYSAAKDWINVRVPVEKVEKLLNTKYSVYTHTDGTSLVRTPEWSLPEHLHEHIDVIQPTNSFFRMSKHTSDVVTSDSTEMTIDEWHKKNPWANHHHTPGTTPNITAICNASFVTLECIRTVYGTIDYQTRACEENSIGITNYLGEISRRADLKQYLGLYRPEATGVADSFPIIAIDNGNTDQGPLNATQLKSGQDIEGNLDAQLVVGISYPTKFSAYTTGGSPPYTPDLGEPTNTNEPYNEWLNYVLAQRDLPQVISTSYGDDEQTVPESYAKRACDGFKQLGARGVSVLFSSGDNGVGSDGTCYSNTDPNKATFLPAFPASCPFVTSVGSTANFEPEVATLRFGSGAGFSNYFKQPSYQHWAVQGYLNKIGNTYAGLYNPNGRAYPDVAAQGNHDVIVYNGLVRTVGGTSASAPTFSAVIALVNDALISHGRPPLGFLNPWIYGGAYKALTDITSGSSIGCNGTGFAAAEGWDPVTGFGTPKFGELVKAAFSKGQGY
ncbi:Hypothetical protein R9X50_00032800 [Acrodontium crateriforme]|uniref:tripeptidyl-peptidase II n=1 Tax=Acrodontium crateriforme TaxID=150365 RepID=A0AAQ3LX23_9PEZI|nr:Hypothetical protein R9X50_00032800 [Acrodontium crateriforme]